MGAWFGRSRRGQDQLLEGVSNVRSFYFVFCPRVEVSAGTAVAQLTAVHSL